MSRTISDKIRLIIDANPNKALAQLKRFNAGLRRVAIGAQQVQMALASISFVAGGAFAYIAKEAVSFDDALRKIESKLSRGTTEAQLEAIRKKAEQLGETTSYSAVEVAGMMKALAQAGKSADEILELSDAMVLFGRAADMDSLEASTDMLTKMLSMFDKGSEDAEHFADVLVYGARSATTTVSELAEGLRMLGPLMSNLSSGSFEEAVATLAVMASSGESDSRGGRGARSSQLQMLVKEARDMYQELGIELEDHEGRLKTIATVQGEVNEALKDETSELKKITALKVTNGKIGVNAGIITGKQADQIKEMTLRMRALVDETKIANAILEGGVGGSLRRLRSALQGLVLVMGKDLTANLAILSDTLIKGVVQPLTTFIKSTQNFASKLGLAAVVSGVGSIAAGLTAVAAIVVSNVISAFIGLVSITATLAKNIAGVAIQLVTKFPQIAAAAAGIALVFSLFSTNARKARDTIQGLESPLKTLDSALNGIIDSLVLGDWEGAMDVMEKAWAVAVAAMRLEWEKFKDDIKEGTMNITGWAGYIKEAFTGDSGGFAEAGRKAASDLVDMANEKLAPDKQFNKKGGLFSGDAAGFKSNKQHEFPADMAAAIGGQKKANAIFKRLRDEYYDMRDPASQRFAVGAGTQKAANDLAAKEQEMLDLAKEKNKQKMEGVLNSRKELAEMKRQAAMQSVANYNALKDEEKTQKAIEENQRAIAEYKEAQKKVNEARWSDFKDRAGETAAGLEKAMNRTLFVAKTVGPRVWAAYFFEQGKKTRKFKKDMNEVKDVVKEISFGKLGSFDIGTAQAELNAKLNDNAARQLDAQLRIAKSNDEINEVLKRNGVGLRVGN